MISVLAGVVAATVFTLFSGWNRPMSGQASAAAAAGAMLPAGGASRGVDDGSGAFRSKQYRNLFVEEGKSPNEVHARIEKAFQQLFHGDALTERVYFEAGSNANGPLGYMTDWANNDARTEGMSYGMMIAVQMDKKREFDALWNWSNTYMLITDPKNPNVGYFAWSMNTDGTPRSTGPAPDGEEYYAMALLFAARRWGNGQGIYNYQAQAEKILSGMRHHPVLTGTGPFRIHPEDTPFEYDDSKFQSPNKTERLQAEKNVNIELKGEGKTPLAKPGRPAWAGAAHTETAGPMVDEAHTMIRLRAQCRTRLYGCVVSSAGVFTNCLRGGDRWRTGLSGRRRRT